MLEDPPFDLLCPGRRPTGLGPVLLPFLPSGDPDWNGFAHLLGRAADTPLLPGVNLGPGVADLLDASTRAEVLATTGAALGGSTFVAGVRAEAGADGGFDPARLAGLVDGVARHDGIPVLLPSPALASLGPDEFVGLVSWMGDWCDRLLVVEAPAERWLGGRTWGIDVFGALLENPACVGVVHASWRRGPEWDRLRMRDDRRSGFQIFSSNEHAVDQVMFGADHALDLAAAVPDSLADRDVAWEAEDPGVVERHDALQALASLVFRPPVAASRHALARVLHLRGWLPHDHVHPALPRRPQSDDELLLPALDRLGLMTEPG